MSDEAQLAINFVYGEESPPSDPRTEGYVYAVTYDEQGKPVRARYLGRTEPPSHD